MAHKCDSCNKEFSSRGSLEQHKSMSHQVVEVIKPKRNLRKYFIIISLILITGLVSATVYINSSKPGQYDKFAKCLSDNGVVVYGNDHCSYTIQNLNFFGKSKKYLNYVKCVENKSLCNDLAVKITPTWEIDGKTYSGVLNFDRLSELSGCAL